MKSKLNYVFNVQTRNEYLKTVNPSLWGKVCWFIGRTTRNSAIVASFGVVGYISAVSYNYVHPRTVYADKEIVVESTSTPPVMQRIAKCESGNNQFAPNGQVLIKVNTDKSTDIGYYQINSVWYAQASKLGYNLAVEKDNKAFAAWIYSNRGTGDWFSSQSCWSK